jgi:putative endonuclease
MKQIKEAYFFGIWAEKLAKIYLFFMGYKIIDNRYRNFFGEIDLIATKKKLVSFIEVKARKKKINLAEIITDKQIKRIKKAAEFFIQKNPKYQSSQLSFDLITLEKKFKLKHYKNFFN